MTEEVLQKLAIDSDSDMEPEDDDFWLDGDDFVLKINYEAVLDEPVLLFFFLKKVWKVFVY